MQNNGSIPPLVSWENSKSLVADLKALIKTCGAVLFRPADFFKSLVGTSNADIKRRVWRAVLFAFILGYTKLFFDVANLTWLKYVSKDIFPVAALSTTAILSSPFFFFRPVVVFVLTLGLMVAGVKLVLGLDKVLLPVFWVACYKSAADIFYVIPFFGGVLASVWSLALVVVGVREIYGASTFRSVVAAAVMPLLILFFIILSAGTSLNRVILRFYPEARPQVVKLNDATAYIYTSAIASGAKAYKQELGFYPAHLGALKKYLGAGVVDDVADADNATGYVYDYRRVGDERFIIQARPRLMNHSGRFIFYADETGGIRLNGPQGPLIEDLKKMENLIAAGAS